MEYLGFWIAPSIDWFCVIWCLVVDDSGQKVFEWDQTLEEVNVYITLPPNVPTKLFYCKIQSKHVEVGIKGNPPYLNVFPLFIWFSPSVCGFCLDDFDIWFFLGYIILALCLWVLFGWFWCLILSGFGLWLQHDLSCPVKTDSSFWTLGMFLFSNLFI